MVKRLKYAALDVTLYVTYEENLHWLVKFMIMYIYIHV